MTASGSDFSAACRVAARQLRRLPAELRRTLAREVKTEVADPLAGQISQAWRGPQGAALAKATKSRVQADPQIVVGGARRLLTGGATARDIVFGNEFGGGKRVATVAARGNGKPYRRHTTRQFPTSGQHAVFGTVDDNLDEAFANWVDAVDKIIGRVMEDG